MARHCHLHLICHQPCKRGLTTRSSGAPTAGHQARSGGTRYIFASPGLASCRCRPLSSNVRPQNQSRSSRSISERVVLLQRIRVLCKDHHMKRTSLSLLIFCLSGCSTAAVYDYIAMNTDPDCSRYVNAEERSRCVKQANVSYEQYEKERRKAQGKQAQ